MTTGDEHEEYQRRLAARQAEQERLHALDPQHVPLYIPADDPEFATEAYTAGWEEEEDEDQVSDAGDGDDDDPDEVELVEVGLAIVSWRDWQVDGVLVFPSSNTASDARRGEIWAVGKLYEYAQGSERTFDELSEDATWLSLDQAQQLAAEHCGVEFP
jgi:hypothetical protein